MKGWRGPRYEGEFPTLGWEVLQWFRDRLPSPADDTKPLILTDEQAHLVLDWYRIEPMSGLFLWRRGAIEMAKGWGKSPLAAAIAICEFAGPARFDGWDAQGEPVGKPWGTGEDPPPWVQIAANAEDQSENTYGAIYGYLTARDHRIAAELGIDQGRTRLYLKANPTAKLEPVTASAGTREGQRITFAVLDETHLWTRRSGGLRLAATLRRNVGKMSGRTLETTNAPTLGEHSVAEDTGEQAGEPGIYLHTRRPDIEPQPDWPDDRLRDTLRHVYGQARWVDTDRILREVRDPATEWTDALRFYFNIRASGAGKAVDPRRWAALIGEMPLAGTRIGLGFDGSLRRDFTALVGCTAEGTSFLVGAWQADPIPRSEVQSVLAATFERYDVGLLLADPPRWQTEIEGWITMWGEERVVMFDTNQPRRMAPAVDRWLTAIAEGSHRHVPDDVLDAHVLAAHKRKVRLMDPEDDGRTRYVLGKGGDTQHIDAAIADVLAHEAAKTMPAADGPSIYETQGLTVI